MSHPAEPGLPIELTFANRENPYSLSKRATAEFIGTFWLVFGGCGSAGFVGVALAFGLTVLTIAYAIGYISGIGIQAAD